VPRLPLILCYHKVEPRRELGVTRVAPDRFGRQIEGLAREGYRALTLAELVACARGERAAGEREVAITFDDAYWGAVTVGAAELAQRRIPATVFVTPHFLGRTFWWDAIEWPGGSAWRAPFREHALTALAGRDDLVRRAASQHGLRVGDPPDYLRCASEEDLHQAVASAPITLGSHTWSHPNLTALTAVEVREELERPLEWLAGRFDRVQPLLAYPYGSFSDRVVEATRAVGYAGAFTIGGGWIRGAPRDVHRIPRMNVDAQLSLDGFVLSTAGLPRS
jgi:peptidoglycan/xylan/chitin deacetylase (PgdA/CDA1 family)